MSKKLIVANWKMNPQTQKEAEKIISGYLNFFKSFKIKVSSSEVVICPPFVYLDSIKKKLQASSFKFQARLGAQDVFYEQKGAYTGEISADMLKDLKCKYVIVGHSERRKYSGETDEVINKKVLTALKAGLNVVLCVGEHYRDNASEIPKVVEEQITAALKGVPKSFFGKIVVAYEPVWAIGTGTPDTPEGAMMAAVLIRKTAIGILGQNAKNLPVLYGGSVNAENSAKFINHEGIDGVLVGGASLDPEEFAKIVGSAII